MSTDLAAIGRYYLDRAEHVAAHLEAGHASRTDHCTESPCETGESVDEDTEFLDVEWRGTDPETAHVRIAWALGGPGVYLIRGWDEDEIVVAGWGGKWQSDSPAITSILDYYASMADYFGGQGR